jgi:GNAT superfamily N-acetyltransferase
MRLYSSTAAKTRSGGTSALKQTAKAQGLRIRRGMARDIPKIVSLLRELAKYERLTPDLRISARRLRAHGFGRRRYFEALICERGGQVVGYAIYYFAYSSFTCRPVLFIEDIFVLPEERGRGAGKAMMGTLARAATRAGCEQMEWIVLDWNAPSIKFYEQLGARLDKAWVLTRLTGTRLRRLAQLR